MCKDVLLREKISDTNPVVVDERLLALVQGLFYKSLRQE